MARLARLIFSISGSESRLRPRNILPAAICARTREKQETLGFVLHDAALKICLTLSLWANKCWHTHQYGSGRRGVKLPTEVSMKVVVSTIGCCGRCFGQAWTLKFYFSAKNQRTDHPTISVLAFEEVWLFAVKGKIKLTLSEKWIKIVNQKTHFCSFL